MDWLRGMNNIIAYIEENLTQPIEYQTLARGVGCSVYEFSRIFSFMAGMSVSEYVRRRRLSQAVFDIQNGGEKIIDIALKYCYESPAAFTRAFKELHGVAPLAARKSNVPLKNYPAIKFVLSIKGVNEMKFKIIEKSAFSVIGLKLSYNGKNDYDDFDDYKIIQELWQKTPKESYDKLSSLADDKSAGFMGIFSRHYLESDDYLITVASTKDIPEGSGFVKYDIPATRWAVLENSGDATNLHERFWTEWLPSSGYSRAGRLCPTIELYQNKDTYNEVWFPIESPSDIAKKRKEADAELKKIEAATPRSAPVNIDLKSMIPHEDANSEMTLNYTDDGLMVLHTMGGDSRTGTPQEFSVPLKIELRAKTDSTNLRIYYAGSNYSEGLENPHGGWIIFHYFENTDHIYNSLGVNDPFRANDCWHDGFGYIPVDEFVDVEWIIGEKVMSVKVNGELRYTSCEHEYIEALKNSGCNISGRVYPAAGRGSTVTIEKLRVTEI